MSNSVIVKAWKTVAGLNAYVVLVNNGSHHCGYVEAPEHMVGKPYENIESDIDVHGGVTYAGTAYFKDNPDVWVFGYDCAHAGDKTAYSNYLNDVWRDVDYCTEQCELMAKQLAVYGLPVKPVKATDEIKKVVERFEAAVREKVLFTETDQFYGLPDEQLLAISEYNDAKAELLERILDINPL